MKMIKVLVAAVLISTPLLLMGAQRDTNEKESLRAARACTPATGNAATINTATGSSTAFAALNPNSVYLLRCTTDTYVCTGTSACTATSSNFPVPPSVFPIYTSETVIHLATRARATNGACWVWECN